MNRRKRGIVLIMGLIAVLVISVLAAALFFKVSNESRLVGKFQGSTKAFWAAEAGASLVFAQWKGQDNPTAVPSTDFDGTDTGYEVNVTQLVDCSANPPVNQWRITSTGSWKQIQRTVEVIAQKPCPQTGITLNPDSLTKAVESTGDLVVKGSVDINPDGSEKSQSTLDFQEVFGATKDQIKALADHTYTNPSKNQQPVNGITWVDLTGTNRYKISSNWSGSGLLIINGNGTDIALDIAGQWNFNGMIWVVGELSISGNPTLTGAVFAESAINVDNTLTGNATLNFNEDNKDGAFDLITQKLSQQNRDLDATFISWEETD